MHSTSYSHLIAFDAAARHRSFTLAAVEQNVSQPAISRRVAALELELSCSLFDRSTKPMGLTFQGEKLFDTLRSGLSRLDEVFREIRSSSTPNTVSISAASGFLAFWLLPKLPDLQLRFSSLNVRVISEEAEPSVTSGDVQIRFGDGNWPDVSAVKILGEEIYPVCSPAYLMNRSEVHESSLSTSDHLLQIESKHKTWFEWQAWFDAHGGEHLQSFRTTTFNSYVVTVTAALAGHGICLCWDGLLDTLLQTGALVRMGQQSVRSERGYYVTFSDGLPASSSIHPVSQWLIDIGVNESDHKFITSNSSNV